MRNYLNMLASALILLGWGGLARAEDVKAMTLKGTLECGKCALHETDACSNVLDVKSGTTDTKYYLVDNDLTRSDHAKICTAPKDNVSVTGTISEKDGKKWLTATAIEFPK